jgi:hypothetical protein
VDVLILVMFVSLFFAGGAVALFVWTVRQGGDEHADRLALLPLDSDHQER